MQPKTLLDLDTLCHLVAIDSRSLLAAIQANRTSSYRSQALSLMTAEPSTSDLGIFHQLRLARYASPRDRTGNKEIQDNPAAKLRLSFGLTIRHRCSEAGAAKILMDPFLSGNPFWDKRWIGYLAGEN